MKEKNFYDEDGELIARNKYNEKGFVVEKEEYDKEGKVTISSKYYYEQNEIKAKEYYEKIKLTKKDYYKAGKLTAEEYYTYNKAGKFIERYKINIPHTRTEVNKYEYDQAGNLTYKCESKYKSHGKQEKNCFWGRVTSRIETKYNKEGKLTEKKKHKYDEVLNKLIVVHEFKESKEKKQEQVQERRRGRRM